MCCVDRTPILPYTNQPSWETPNPPAASMGHSHGRQLRGAKIHEKPPECSPAASLRPCTMGLHVTQRDVTEPVCCKRLCPAVPHQRRTWVFPPGLRDINPLDSMLSSPSRGPSPPRSPGEDHWDTSVSTVLIFSLVSLSLFLSTPPPFYFFLLLFLSLSPIYSQIKSMLLALAHGLVCTLIRALPIRNWTVTDVLQVRDGHSPKSPSVMKRQQRLHSQCLA